MTKAIGSGGSRSQAEILKTGNRLGRWLVAHQLVDLIGALGLGLVLWLVVPCENGLGTLDATGRRATYQTLSGLSATLLGLTMTTISVLASTIDKPIGGSPKGLPQKLVIGISRRMFGLIRALGFTVVASLALLVLDTTSARGVSWAQPVLGAAAAVVAARLVRVLVLLSNLLRARSTG